MPLNPPNNAHGFTMQISKSEKEFLAPFPNPGYAPDTRVYVLLQNGEVLDKKYEKVKRVPIPLAINHSHFTTRF